MVIWVEKGGYMVSPQNPFHDILMFAFLLFVILIHYFFKK